MRVRLGTVFPYDDSQSQQSPCRRGRRRTACRVRGERQVTIPGFPTGFSASAERGGGRPCPKSSIGRRSPTPPRGPTHDGVLLAGGVACFPTEGVPVLAASGLIPEAIDRLRAGGAPLDVAVRGPAAARDWLPSLGLVPRRLARRSWPGPLTLLAERAREKGVASRLPDRVREAVCPGGSLRLRCPGHAAILEVARPPDGAAGPDAGTRTGGRRGGPDRQRRTRAVPDADGRRRRGRGVASRGAGGGDGGDAPAAVGVLAGVRLHRQHLPQPAGRGAVQEAAGRTARLHGGRLAGARIFRAFGGAGGDDGRPGGGRGGATWPAPTGPTWPATAAGR